MALYDIIEKTQIGERNYVLMVDAPLIAQSGKAGQFVVLRVDEVGERIPLTIVETYPETGLVELVFLAAGRTTNQLATLKTDDQVANVLGPLGHPTEVKQFGTVAVIGGGVGIGAALPVANAMRAAGNHVIGIIGARTADLLIYEERMAKACQELVICTDDGSRGMKGFVSDALIKLLDEGRVIDFVFVIGPTPMMRALSRVTAERGIKTVASLNPIMVDGTGMCGACRVTVAGKTRFTCKDGPDFDAHEVDWDELSTRQRMYRDLETAPTEAEQPVEYACNLTAGAAEVDLTLKTRQPMREQPVAERIHNFSEVPLGYTAAQARVEAARCLQCKNAPCIADCPVHIEIPGFIKPMVEGNFREGLRILKQATTLPAICGRVCPQEDQCQKRCTRGRMDDVIGIGYLERFLADWERENLTQDEVAAEILRDVKPRGLKMAIIGSGPAGLTCAGELARAGCEVTLFESLHKPGGVLMYGIPEFRLPKSLVEYEAHFIEALGVTLTTDVLIGRTLTLPQLFEQGYQAAFIGAGAGLPSFMNIPGENANGIYSANELLTRINLMKAYLFPLYATPVELGDKVVVIGAGNVAMDAARASVRAGAKQVSIIYRRTRNEMPARIEEIQRAEEEGISFQLLQAPLSYEVDDKGHVKAALIQRMELGEPDASGRRRPVPLPGSEFRQEVDNVVVAIGQVPSPLLADVTEGLELNDWGGLWVDEVTMMTSVPGVFAGGDIVSGAATVISAMGAGKEAAALMIKYAEGQVSS